MLDFHSLLYKPWWLNSQNILREHKDLQTTVAGFRCQNQIDHSIVSFCTSIYSFVCFKEDKIKKIVIMGKVPFFLPSTRPPEVCKPDVVGLN